MWYFERCLHRESVIFDIFWSCVLTVVISKLLFGALGGCKRILILCLSSYANNLSPSINRKARQKRSVLYWVLVLRALYCVSVEHSIRLPYDNRSFPGPYPARLDLLWLRKIRKRERCWNFRSRGELKIFMFKALWG